MDRLQRRAQTVRAAWGRSLRVTLGLVLAAGLLAGCAGSMDGPGGDVAGDPALRDLSVRFADEVPDTILFDFDRAALDAQARAVLDAQAAFIRSYPQVWFRVEGHADRVGSPAYNQALGLRRANAALDYLVARGVNREQLEALVSFGEDRPAIETEDRERQNRRVVTEVGGFLDPACNCRKRPGVE